MGSSVCDLTTLLTSDFITCDQCGNVYRKPVLLPCLHSLCQPCLQRYLGDSGVARNGARDQQEKCEDRTGGTLTDGGGVPRTFPCPQCNTPIPVPHNGLQGFLRNHFLDSLVDLALCKLPSKKDCEYCQYDKISRPAVARCLSCHDDMCVACTDAHRRTKLTRQHQVALFDDLQTGQHDRAIRQHQHLSCMDHVTETLKFYCNKCDVLLCDECLKTTHECHSFSDVHKAAEAYKAQTMKVVMAIDSKTAGIENQLHLLANYDSHLCETRNTIKLSLENQAQALHKLVEKYKESSLVKLERATTKETDISRKKKADLESVLHIFKFTSDYLTALLQHAKPEEILGAHKIITDRLAQLVYLKVDNLGNKVDFRFHAGSPSIQNLEHVFGKVEARVVPFEKATLGSALDSLAKITHISIGEKVELVSSFSCRSETDTKDTWPTGLAIGRDGTIVIVDRQNKKVKIYDDNCVFIKEFGHDGDTGFGNPFDVAILNDGRIAVSDYDKEEVKLFSKEGKMMMSINENLKYPRGITITNNNEVIILDAHHRQIYIHSSDTGALLRTIQGKGDDDFDLFTDPYYVTTNQNGYIIATDWAAPNMKIFDPRGRYLTHYGSYGCQEDQVLQPYGLCTDTSGHIFVADHQNHRIHLLAPDGQFLRFVVTKQHNLWHPMAIAIDHRGHLVVTEALGNVKVFKYI